MKKKIWLSLSILGIVALLFVFASCGGHEHSFDTNWQKDETNHWHTCTVEGCEEKSNVAAHTYTTTEVPAKCGIAGKKIEACVCGLTKETSIPALEHDVLENVVAPTCTEDGYTELSCKREGCDYKEVKNIVPASHTIVETVVAPTCTEKGYTQRDCSVCDFSEIVNETDVVAHTYEEKTVEPTCTEEGYTANVCTVCGDTLEKTDIVDELGHDKINGTPVAPTCTEKGYTPVTCSRCDFTDKSEFVDELGHDEIKGESVAPTCTEEGYTHVTCSRCDYVGKSDFVAAAPHSYYMEEDAREDEHYRVIEIPTCDQPGKKVYWCFTCNDYPFDGDNNIREIPALGHDEQYEIVLPNCDSKGATIVTCSRCDYNSTKDEVDPLGHTYYKEADAIEGTHFVVTLAPTCTEKGERSYYCQVESCGKLATDDTNGKGEIPALGHNWVVSVQPWCGNDSNFEYVCDRICREVPCTEVKTEKAQEEVRHTYDPELVKVFETCVDYAIYECPVCYKDFTAYAGDEVGQPTNVHSFDSVFNVTAPTCTAKGYTTYSCTAGACGLTEDRDYTDITPHTLGDVSENGTTTCQVCNKSYVDVTAEKVTGSDALCICGQDPCVCGGTSADWEGYAKPKEPMSITANEKFAINEVEWADGKHALSIGDGLIVLNGTEETEYTVVIYAENGGEAIATFTVSGAYVMIDLYQHETVTMVEITSTTDASVSFYKTI
ncbi:MAG: hypothetical protein J6B45_03745 [Clostridia bacterium]|nr:hypothetical protein [Clostridia bacterium]